MEFGIFDHLDASGAPLADYYEERLAIVELLDRAGFYSYHLADITRRRWAWRRRRACSSPPSRSAPGGCGSGR
jgi:hypothetical protein